jgi:hypothetical protein
MFSGYARYRTRAIIFFASGVKEELEIRGLEIG